MSLLKKGDKAPSFESVDQNGHKINLNDFAGTKVVLYFYPKDDTPGCTTEACNLRDNHDLLLNLEYKVIGVSVDSQSSHKKFAEKYNLPFTLLADTSKEIVNAYGVWGPKKFMGRSYDGTQRVTYVIDEQGFIEKVINKVDTKNHAQQILGNG